MAKIETPLNMMSMLLQLFQQHGVVMSRELRIVVEQMAVHICKNCGAWLEPLDVQKIYEKALDHVCSLCNHKGTNELSADVPIEMTAVLGKIPVKKT